MNWNWGPGHRELWVLAALTDACLGCKCSLRLLWVQQRLGTDALPLNLLLDVCFIVFLVVHALGNAH